VTRGDGDCKLTVDADRGQAHNGDAGQALASVAVPSGMIPEQGCAQSKIGLENGDGDASAI
jgi:hypothetical protein